MPIRPARTPSDVVQWLLFAYAMLLGLNMGGALLASTAIFPVWSSSAEAAISWNRTVDESRFFVIISPVVLVLAVLVVVSSARLAQELSRPMRPGAALYILFFGVTLGYFVPEQEALQGELAASLSSEELSLRLSRWVRLNWLRQGLGIAAFGIALRSVGISYGMRIHPASERHSGAPAPAQMRHPER